MTEEAKPKRTRKSAAEAAGVTSKKAAVKTDAPGVAAAPAGKAAEPKTVRAKPAAEAKPKVEKAPAKRKLAAPKPALDAEFRSRLINDTAYYLSEKRNSGGSPDDDWAFAELLIDSVAFAVGSKKD